MIDYVSVAKYSWFIGLAIGMFLYYPLKWLHKRWERIDRETLVYESYQPVRDAEKELQNKLREKLHGKGRK